LSKSPAVFVAIALGSNLGDRQQHLAFAHARLANVLAGLHLSPVIETAPVDVPDTQGAFLNQAATGLTTLDPETLLRALQAIELDAGRARPFPNAARTLDLDLVLYGDVVMTGADLTVPHPRFRERRFVLEPLAMVAPDLRDPVSGLTVAELLARLPPAPPAPRP
jgi:2-amino-4-hydroxy-6-hydroxymethyldihydropteridine diphosphokinase